MYLTVARKSRKSRESSNNFIKGLIPVLPSLLRKTTHFVSGLSLGMLPLLQEKEIFHTIGTVKILQEVVNQSVYTLHLIDPYGVMF